jgi:hypothetical protein
MLGGDPWASAEMAQTAETPSQHALPLRDPEGVSAQIPMQRVTLAPFCPSDAPVKTRGFGNDQGVLRAGHDGFFQPNL